MSLLLSLRFALTICLWLLYSGGEALRDQPVVFPGCVVTHEEDILGRIDTGYIRLLEPLKKKTDDNEFYADVVSTIENHIEGVSQEEWFDLIVVVYTKLGTRPYRQLAATVMCEGGGVENAKCRNRSYYVFDRLPAPELAEALLDDMTFERSRIVECRYGE